MTRKINRIQRLARREEEATVKRILIISVISIFIVIAIFTAGPGFLGKFADIVDTIFKNRTSTGQNSVSALSTPTLNEIPQATNSARLKISGYSPDGNKIEIYKDGEKVADTTVSDGKFEYDEINLDNGSNEIKVKAVTDSGGQSDFSQTAIVNLIKKEPQLSVSSPVDGQNFSGNNHVAVQGSTDVNAQVFANGFLANVTNDGKFSVTIPLVDGDNNIEVKALDEAGNTKIVKLKVHFSK